MSMDDLKKSKRKNEILSTVFGILTGVALLTFFSMLAISDDEEETSNVVAIIGTVSFVLFVIFVALAGTFASALNKDQKRIDAVNDGRALAENVDAYLAYEKDKEDKNKQAIKRAKKEGETYYYDEAGNVHVNYHPKQSKTKNNSWLDDKPEDHEIFDDPDIDDVVIMDFLDDDEDNFD